MVASPSRLPFEPQDADSLSTATEWLFQLATGPIAGTLSILAVAAIGLLMLAGRLPLREGARVVIGSFVLLGAPAIAAALLELGGHSLPPDTSAWAKPLVEPPAELPPSNYDPYAGASLRSE
jgi:type IV secretion system protein VirB2